MLSIHDEDKRFLQLSMMASVSRDVVKRLRSHNFDSIRPILQQLDAQDLHDVVTMCWLELGILRSTPHLDVIFKATIRQEQGRLAIIRNEVLAFKKESFRIDHELLGYQKYVAQVLLTGDGKVDPLDYNAWLELQPDNLKLSAR